MHTATIQMLSEEKYAGQRKCFHVYDGAGNVTDTYTAQATASGGEECLRQSFTYTTVSGQSLLEKSSFQPAVWSGAEWDIS